MPANSRDGRSLIFNTGMKDISRASDASKDGPA